MDATTCCHRVFCSGASLHQLLGPITWVVVPLTVTVTVCVRVGRRALKETLYDRGLNKRTVFVAIACVGHV